MTTIISSVQAVFMKVYSWILELFIITCCTIVMVIGLGVALAETYSSGLTVETVHNLTHKVMHTESELASIKAYEAGIKALSAKNEQIAMRNDQLEKEIAQLKKPKMEKMRDWLKSKFGKDEKNA